MLSNGYSISEVALSDIPTDNVLIELSESLYFDSNISIGCELLLSDILYINDNAPSVSIGIDLDEFIDLNESLYFLDNPVIVNTDISLSESISFLESSLTEVGISLNSYLDLLYNKSVNVEFTLSNTIDFEIVRTIDESGQIIAINILFPNRSSNIVFQSRGSIN